MLSHWRAATAFIFNCILPAAAPAFARMPKMLKLSLLLCKVSRKTRYTSLREEKHTVRSHEFENHGDEVEFLFE